MVQNGEPLLIDMDTLCRGHPVFEIGSMFNALVGYSELNHQNMLDFFGYTFETAGEFWNTALKMYLGTNDEADSSAKVARCKEMLAYLLSKVDTLIF